MKRKTRFMENLFSFSFLFSLAVLFIFKHLTKGKKNRWEDVEGEKCMRRSKTWKKSTSQLVLCSFHDDSQSSCGRVILFQFQCFTQLSSQANTRLIVNECDGLTGFSLTVYATRLWLIAKVDFEAERLGGEGTSFEDIGNLQIVKIGNTLTTTGLVNFEFSFHLLSELRRDHDQDFHLFNINTVRSSSWDSKQSSDLERPAVLCAVVESFWATCECFDNVLKQRIFTCEITHRLKLSMKDFPMH